MFILHICCFYTLWKSSPLKVKTSLTMCHCIFNYNFILCLMVSARRASRIGMMCFTWCRSGRVCQTVLCGTPRLTWASRPWLRCWIVCVWFVKYRRHICTEGPLSTTERGANVLCHKQFITCWMCAIVPSCNVKHSTTCKAILQTKMHLYRMFCRWLYEWLEFHFLPTYFE